MLLVDEIKLKVDESENLLKNKLLKKLNIKDTDLISYSIYNKSLDARKELNYVYTLKVDVKNENKLIKNKKARIYKTYPPFKKINTNIKPIIIGDGPSGLFCALALMEANIKCIVIEKGKDVDMRKNDVDKFFDEGFLDIKSNVQYGEGGAGTFSDAKLTTRIKDPYIEFITNKFIEGGASRDISISSHPHIGTDKIIDVIKNLRNDLIFKGTEFHFEEEAIDLIIEKEKVIGIKTDKDVYYSDYIILALGHSSINSIKMLKKHNVYIEAKEFSIGFRVEHPQELINKNQYKNHQINEAAEYFLRHQTSNNRGVYSFCMCPGGYVIPSSCEKNTIVTNGMSYSKRDNHLANSAILCQIFKTDLDDDLYSGYNYINSIERKAYQISNSYKALSQNIKDYLKNDLNDLIFKSSYPLGTYNYDINKLFDDELNIAFKEALINFDNKINGFIDHGIIVAPETKSSSPFRIKRNTNFQSISHSNLYPIGEGAGYAGGIMSSALDGVKCALKIIEDIL